MIQDWLKCLLVVFRLHSVLVNLVGEELVLKRDRFLKSSTLTIVMVMLVFQQAGIVQRTNPLKFVNYIQI